MQKLSNQLIQSRTCYKHMAGELGVAIAHGLYDRGYIEHATVQQKHCFALTEKGRRWCEQHGIEKHLSGNGDGLPQQVGKELCKSCMDYSHRVPHLAGKWGRALLAFMLARRYCRTLDRRGLLVTAPGVAFLHTALGIDWVPAEPLRESA